MTEDKFWKIIEKSGKGANGSHARQTAALRELLAPLSLAEVVAFDKIFLKMVYKAYSWDLWGAFYLINGGCSDDSFEYCRRGLVAAGRKKFESALRDPESLADWAKPDALDFEDINDPAYKLYREKGGAGLIPNHNLDWPDITGEDWDEESDDLEKRFPKLWARFGG